MAFEILNGLFMLLGGRATVEGAQVSSLTRLRIFLARVEPVLA